MTLDPASTAEDQALQADIAALRGRFTETRELYREVCALLFFRYGVTPTANKLYSLVRKGSMSTPSHVLNRFWQDLRDKTRVTIDHPDLPEALKQVAAEAVLDRKSVVSGKSVDLGGRRIIKKNRKKKKNYITRSSRPVF